MPLAGVNAKETLKRKNTPAVPCRLPAECPHYVQKALHRPYIKHCLELSNEVHKNMTLNIYSVTSWGQVTLVSKCPKKYHCTSKVCLLKYARAPKIFRSKSWEHKPIWADEPTPADKNYPMLPSCRNRKPFPVLVCRRNGTGGAACPQQCKASQSTCSALNAHKTPTRKIFLQRFCCSTKFTTKVLDLEG